MLKLFNFITKKETSKSCNASSIKQKKSSKLFPSTVREWDNSIYLYNKNVMSLLPITQTHVIKIILNYFNLFNKKIEDKIRKRKLTLRFKRLSLNKIFVTNGEYKHTNNKVIITIYTYNRQKINYILMLKRHIKCFFKKSRISKKNHNNRNKLNINKVNVIWKFFALHAKKPGLFFKNKENGVYKAPPFVFNTKDVKTKEQLYNQKYTLQEINYKLKKNLFNKNYVNKLKTIKKISMKVLNEKYRYKLIRALKNLMNNNYDKLVNYTIQEYVFKFQNRIIKLFKLKLKIYFYYKKLLYINKSKFNYTFLQYLKKYLEFYYNKNVEFNLINLKKFYLNSEILSEVTKLRITKNRRKMKRYMNKIKDKIRIRKIPIFSPLKTSYTKLLSSILVGETTKSLNSPNKVDTEIKKTKLFYLDNNMSKLTHKRDIISKFVYKNLKHKYLTGFRLEARGRLTKRYTASRSMYKLKYKGNLLDIDSSFRGLSTVLLRGNLKSNLEYTKSKSKTRIGSFGLKSWISGN